MAFVPEKIAPISWEIALSQTISHAMWAKDLFVLVTTWNMNPIALPFKIIRRFEAMEIVLRF
jgi:hypothetical protein